MFYTIRALKLSMVIAVFLLPACASGPVHFADKNRIVAVKDHSYKVGTIEVPCTLDYSLILGGTLLKEKQLSMLEKIQSDEIIQILTDEYGLNTAATNNLETKSKTIHFMALFSSSRGRCFYKESDSLTPESNTVDIAYSTLESCKLSSGCTESLRYSVVVKEGGKVLIKHEDEIASFKFISFIGNSEIEQIIANAGSIPAALRRDIQRKTNVSGLHS